VGISLPSAAFDVSANLALYAGDRLDMLGAMPSSAARLVVTSPPYNVGKSYESTLSTDAYVAAQEATLVECVRVLAPDGSLCWQVGNALAGPARVVPIDCLLWPVFERLGLKLRNRIVWTFGHGEHCKRRLSPRYETLLWFTKTDDYVFDVDPIRVPQKYPGKKSFRGPRAGQFACNPLGKNPGDVWEIPNVKSAHPEKTMHPCQFPVELIERLVLSLTKPGDLVVDPYCGVGSALVAALKHGRRAAGSDLSAQYVAIARKRIAALARGELPMRPMGRPLLDPRDAGAVGRRPAAWGG
jgi:adenine-specific DNA-methyltransferase